MKIKGIRLLAIAVLAAGVAAAQQQRSRALGVVDSIDSAGGLITLHTDAGPTVKIVPQDNTRFVRLPPGETSLAKATPITAADIQPGDRLLAYGQLSDDKTSLAAGVVVVMTKGDIAKKQQEERSEWQKRGAGGIVTAVAPAANQVTITTRTAEGRKPLIIEVGPQTVIRRYAQDSVKFADAKPGTLADIKPGDQVRALGDKTPDGERLTAEKLVSGSFRNVAATVIAVDPAANTLKVTDLTTKKPVLVHVTADSTMRKLPEMVARMIALRTSGAPPAGAAAGGPPHAPNGAAGAPPAGGQGGGGGMRPGRPDMQQMLERMPPLKLEDLKPGDAIIVSSTQGADPNQVTAITLIAGVEPILSAAPAGSQRGAQMLGSWNLEINMGAE